MKIALLNDLHFGLKNNSPVVLKYQEKFFKEVFFPYIDKHNITTLIDLGDTYEMRKYANYEMLYKVDSFFFSELEKRNIDTHILIGNHTAYYKNTNEINSPSLLLKGYKNVTVYDSPKDVYIHDIPLAFIPWINESNEQEFRTFVQKSRASLAFGHFEIKGFQVLRGIVSEQGLDKQVLNRFEYVYSGHFHQKQDNEQIYYLGTQYDMSFSDVNETKGFHVLDLSTKKLTFIENPNKMYYRLVYDETIDNFDFSKYTDSYIKLIVKKKVNTVKFDKFLLDLYNANPADISIIEEFTIVSDSPQQIDQTQDTLSLIFNEVDYLELTEEHKTNLKTILNSLYNESFESSDKSES